MAESPAIQLKLLIDSNAGRVLFAEVDKENIDFLFSLLSIRLGTAIRVLKNHSMAGCLVNLYGSVENLNDKYLQSSHSKDRLMKLMIASNSSFPMLLPDADSPTAPKFYHCRRRSYAECGDCFSDNPKASCPHCGSPMNYAAMYVQPPRECRKAKTGEDEGGYVKDVVSYMVMDDLSVKPMSAISCISLLNKFNVKEVSALQEKVVTFNIDEGVKLLNVSLQSNTVLTDVFLRT